MVHKQHKILIIKLGYSETLIPEIGSKCSLGDVFRTTAVLHLFKDDHVTWLTDTAAIPLLESNPHIDRILPFELPSVLQLESERFDKVINLEKVPGLCALAGRIEAWSHFGFRFDRESGRAEAYELAYEALAMATRENIKKLNNKPWVEVLYSMLGAVWSGESFVLGYQPKSAPCYDLGFNMHVGHLLPLKAWPGKCWEELAGLMGDRYSVTYQQSLDDLYGYMDWINSCRILITSDTLGLYLGIAMGKKVLGLFGPTSGREQSPHPNLRLIYPSIERDCLPCFQKQCDYQDPCMGYITPEQVLTAIEEWEVY
jgi:heptosyltransferase-2